MSQALAEKVAETFGEKIYGVTEHAFARQWRVDIRREAVIDVLRFCKETLELDYLAELTAIDNLQQPAPRPERFAVTYVLHGISRRETLVIRAHVPDGDPAIDSATAVWPKGADWLEREVYDMFGIVFRGHPNLCRILTPENFEGHALRKDFPTEGIGYRDRFPIISREDA